MDHVVRARSADQPIAALIKDLKNLGMLKETLVVITTEFGRPPFEDGSRGAGRSHQTSAFTTGMEKRSTEWHRFLNRCDP